MVCSKLPKVSITASPITADREFIPSYLSSGICPSPNIGSKYCFTLPPLPLAIPPPPLIKYTGTILEAKFSGPNPSLRAESLASCLYESKDPSA